jgi:hypothetical protein
MKIKTFHYKNDSKIAIEKEIKYLEEINQKLQLDYTKFIELH